MSDADRERQVIRVRGDKGNKDRQVMLAEPLRVVLAGVAKAARPHSPRTHSPRTLSPRTRSTMAPASL